MFSLSYTCNSCMYPLAQENFSIPFLNKIIFFIFTNRLVDIWKKWAFCILKRLLCLSEEMICNKFSISDNSGIPDSNDGGWVGEKERQRGTLDSNGRASKAVLRRITLDTSTWLFLARSADKASILTFFDLKQKWHNTLSETIQSVCITTKGV